MKNWKKLSMSAVTLAAVGVALAGCSSSSDGGDKSSTKSARAVSDYITAPVQSLDPALITDTYSSIVVGNTSSGLTRVDSEGVAQPDLAEKIEASEDGLSYTITLRKDLVWSNGDSITSEDFVYSWQRAIDPATGSEYAYLMAPIKNADAINSGENKDVKSLGIEAEDDLTLKVSLEAPTPYFESLVSMSIFFPLEQSVVEEYGKQYGTSSEKTLYSGPFKFTDENNWNGSNTTLSIYKNDDYWDAESVVSDEIKLQVVEDVNTAYNLYKQGDTDRTSVADPSLYKLYKDDENRVDIPDATTAYMEFNQSDKGATSPEAQKALQNKNIRKAIILATNREAYIDQLTPSYKPATGLSPAGLAVTADGEDFAEYAAQDYKYDAAEAKEYWEKGLKELGYDSLTLEFLTDDSDLAKDAATFFKQSWEKDLPGLTLELKTVPFKQRLNDSSNGNFDIVNTLWGGDYADPSTFLDLMKTGSPQNKGGLSNEAVDKALESAHNENSMDPEKLYEDYKAVEVALFEESSINPIYFRSRPTLVNPNLKGVSYNATGLNSDYKYAYIEE
ncbi:MAG: peptide ABC transporter substrate-binding protein [Lactovum sp.]